MANNEISLNIVARDRASREIGRVADEMRDASKDATVLAAAAEGAGDSMREMGRDADHLNRKLADTQRHMQDLARELARTGDVGLLKDIGKDRRLVNQLTSAKKLLGDMGDDAGRGFVASFGDALGALPMQLKGAGIAAGVGVATVAAPLIGAAVAGAVLGGVGAGGIIGGIALAAQDPAVKAAGEQFAESMAGTFAFAGQPVIDPLLESMGELQAIGTDFAMDLRSGLSKLAPTLGPIVRGLDGMVDALGPGLEDAFAAAVPVMRAIGNELPGLGDAISDVLTIISSESDGAIMGLKSMFEIVEFGARSSATAIAAFSAAYEGMIRGAATMSGIAADAVGWVPFLGDAAHDGAGKLGSLIGALDASKDPSNDFAAGMLHSAGAVDSVTKALQKQHNELMAQTDPMFALIDAQHGVTQAQDDYNEAVKRHGRNSREAKDASVALAEAALRMQGAAADASNKFDGKLTPAMLAVLKTAGLTERQIKDVETAFRNATAAGDAFAKPYTAQVSTLGGRFKIEARAHGGGVEAGRTYRVGENGPELVTFGEDGYVHDAAESRSMMAGTSGAFGSAAPVIENHMHFPAPRTGMEALFWSWFQGYLRDNPGIVITTS